MVNYCVFVVIFLSVLVLALYAGIQFDKVFSSEKGKFIYLLEKGSRESKEIQDPFIGIDSYKGF